MKVKSESEVAQSPLTRRDPMDCSLPGSSVHGIFPGKSTGVGCHCLLQLLTQWLIEFTIWDFPGGPVVKNPPAKAGDTGSICGPGRSHLPQSN